MGNTIAEGFLGLLQGAASEYIGQQREKRSQAAQSDLLNQKADIAEQSQMRAARLNAQAREQAVQAREQEARRRHTQEIEDLNNPDLILNNAINGLTTRAQIAYATALRDGRSPDEAAQMASRINDQELANRAVNPALSRQQTIDKLSESLFPVDPNLSFALRDVAEQNPDMPYLDLLAEANKHLVFKTSGLTDENAAAGDGKAIQRAVDNLYKQNDLGDAPRLFHEGEQLTNGEVYSRLGQVVGTDPESRRIVSTILASLGEEITRIKNSPKPQGTPGADPFLLRTIGPSFTRFLAGRALRRENQAKPADKSRRRENQAKPTGRGFQP